MTEVRWTPQAAEDLASVRKYIARESPSYAQAVIARLYTAAGQLSHFPDSGRVVPERGDPAIRELVRAPYRIVYRRREQLVEILTVHHAARPIPPDLGSEGGPV